MPFLKPLIVSVIALLIIVSLIVPVEPALAQGGKGVDEPIRIGMVQTLFTDVPAPLAQAILIPFGAVMKEFTGLNGRMVMGGDYQALAKDVHDGKIDLGVYHGIEYAWALQKYPDLKPLIVCCTKYKHAQAVLVVRKDGNISGIL